MTRSKVTITRGNLSLREAREAEKAARTLGGSILRAEIEDVTDILSGGDVVGWIEVNTFLNGNRREYLLRDGREIRVNTRTRARLTFDLWLTD